MSFASPPVGPGLVRGRTDEGVDWSGAGNILAVGDGTITEVSTDSGWPGGTFIVLHLDNPPLGALSPDVYYAENIAPAVTVGQHVTAGQPLGYARGQYPYIETGFADPAGGNQALGYQQYVEGQPTPQGQQFSAMTGGGSGPVLTSATSAANLPDQLTPLQVLEYAAGAGFPSTVLVQAVAYAFIESGFNRKAVSSAGCVGLWQICGQPVPGDLTDPAVNAANAYAKWKACKGGSFSCDWDPSDGGSRNPGWGKGESQGQDAFVQWAAQGNPTLGEGSTLGGTAQQQEAKDLKRMSLITAIATYGPGILASEDVAHKFGHPGGASGFLSHWPIIGPLFTAGSDVISGTEVIAGTFAWLTKPATLLRAGELLIGTAIFAIGASMYISILFPAVGGVISVLATGPGGKLLKGASSAKTAARTTTRSTTAAARSRASSPAPSARRTMASDRAAIRRAENAQIAGAAGDRALAGQRRRQIAQTGSQSRGRRNEVGEQFFT